jgi:large subunit GTPase 1
MDGEGDALSAPQPLGRKGATLDKAFFAAGQGAGNVTRPFHYKYSEQGKHMSGRKLKTMTALENDLDPEEVRLNSKKHNKANKRAQKKVRAPGVAAYDE